jgi:hypothetical protein
VARVKRETFSQKAKNVFLVVLALRNRVDFGKARCALCCLLLGFINRSGKPQAFFKRTEFCEFLACPEFPVNWHLMSMGRKRF